MLGLANPERPLRRSFSVGMLSGGLLPTGTSGHFPSATLSRPTEHTNSWRRSSLPGGDALAETYNAMAADVRSVLSFFCLHTNTKMSVCSGMPSLQLLICFQLLIELVVQFTYIHVS